MARIIGASILCFSVDPTYAGIYFLLGKEKKTYKFRGSEKWSDFGGSCKNGESAEECAAREFHEESAAIVSFWSDEPLPRPSYHPIVDELNKEQYYMKVEFEHTADVKYVTFVKQVAWDPSYPMAFAKTINQLIKYTKGEAVPQTEVHPAVTNLGQQAQINRDYMEKQALQYWSIPQLKSAVTANKHVLGLKCNRPEMLRETFVSRLASVLEKFPIDMCNELTRCGQFGKYLLHTPLQKHASIILGGQCATERKKPQSTSNSTAQH